MKRLIPLLAALLALSCSLIGAQTSDPPVTPGVEVLLGESEFLELIQGKSVGLITNPTGVDHNLVSTVDLFNDHPDVNLVALFGPEHGVRGDAYAGDHVEDTIDEKTGVPVYSMYGDNRRPKDEWLEGVDVLVYDIQDVGSRSYTYIYTMAYGMEAAAAKDIPFIVLDRPNPAGAHIVDGNILDPEFYSGFVGMYAIPYQYGMTPGETALMFNEEFNAVSCELHVVPMRGYERDMFQEDTGLPFVPASTHIARGNAAIYYNLTGIIGEIRHISIGVGYTLPFETMAAPWMDRDAFCDALIEADIPGLGVRPISYKPRYAGYADEMCHGVQYFLTDRDALRPVSAQIKMMEILHRLFPDQTPFTDEHAKRWLFDEVMGTPDVRTWILEGKTAEEIIATFQPEMDEFMVMRENYLIY